jgi:predicted HicB family RNase H-like nuclease
MRRPHKQLNVRIDPGLYASLEQLARASNVSLNKYVERLLRSMVKRRKERAGD